MEKEHKIAIKKWIRRTILCLVVFVLSAAILIQIILWTDLPRQWVVSAASNRFGIKISAAALSTKWTGTTKIKNLTISLPIEQDALFQASEIHLSHTTLPMILLKRSMTLKSIDINAPTFVIRQSEAGRWNIQDIITILAESKGDKKTNPNRTNLPQLEFTNGTIKIIAPNDETQEIRPLKFQGKHQDSLTWQFEANIPSMLNLQGVISSNSLKTHSINFTIDHMDELLQTWAPPYLCPQYLTGRWDGRLLDKKLTGKLKLDSLRFTAAQVQGSATVQVDPNHILIQPENLSVLQNQLPNQHVNIVSGSINLSPDRIKANHLMLKSEGLVGRLNAQWNTKLEKGEFNGSWDGTNANQNIHHAGTFTGSIKWPTIGRNQLDLTISAQGRSPLGNWENKTEITGAGDTWSTSQWKLSIPHLLWQHKDKELQLGSTYARFVVDWPKIKLHKFDMNNAANVTANGEFSAVDKSWHLQLDAAKINLSDLTKSPIDIRLTAAGDTNCVNITDIQLTLSGWSFSTAGKIAIPSTKLQDLQASISGRINQHEISPEKPTRFAGKWRIDTNIEGTAWPLNLKLKSELIAENIKAGKLNIPKIQAPLQAEVNPEQLRFEMEPFDLIGGTWQMQGRYAFANQSGQVNLNVQELALRTAAKIVDSPLSWRGRVTAALQLKILNLQRDRLKLSGNWSASDVKMPPFQAEHAQGQLSLRNGVLTFDKISLKKGQGNALATMWFSLSQPQNLYVQLTTKNWPFNFSKYPLGLCADCKTTLNLDLATRTATGTGTLSSDILLKNKGMGKLSLNASIDGRNIQLQDIQMQLLGGQAQGNTKIDLDDWPKSTAELSWQNIQLSNLTDCWPRLEGLTGQASVTLSAGPTDEPRALEQMRLDIELQLADANLHKVQLGNGQIIAYAGKKRFLIENSEFEIMDGKLNSRVSISRHTNEPFIFIQTNLDHLDLDQITQIVHPQANTLTGRLTGQATIITSSNLQRLTAEAMLQLTDSDLANNSAIRTLYNALNLNFNSQQASGRGWIKLHAQGQTISIPSFLYFNRGVEIRGAGTIENLKLGLGSKINGYAIASTRPLKGLRLPGVIELDQLMTSLQTGVTSVKIDGTLQKPESNIVPFPQISGELRRLLWGQLRKPPRE